MGCKSKSFFVYKLKEHWRRKILTRKELKLNLEYCTVKKCKGGEKIPLPLSKIADITMTINRKTIKSSHIVERMLKSHFVI